MDLAPEPRRRFAVLFPLPRASGDDPLGVALLWRMAPCALESRRDELHGGFILPPHLILWAWRSVCSWEFTKLGASPYGWELLSVIPPGRFQGPG